MTSSSGNDPSRSDGVGSGDVGDAVSSGSPAPKSRPSGLLLEHACRAVVSSARCDGAAVTVMSAAGARELMYASNALAQYLDDIQFTYGLGPCLEAFSSGVPVICTELSSPDSEHRWLDFTADALAAGAASVFALPLRGGSTVFGVLELYRAEPDVFDEADMQAMQRGAGAVGSLVLAHFAATQGLTSDETALAASPAGEDQSDASSGWNAGDARSHVNFAAGMASVQLGVGIDDALATMRSRAYLEHRSLSDVAEEVVARRIDFRDDTTSVDRRRGIGEQEDDNR